MHAHVFISFAILLLVMSAAIPAEAALLESPKQLIVRYGKPFKVDFGGSVYLFRTRAFTINVNFIDGKSRSETYIPRTRRVLTQREIDSFLQLNSLGSTWQPTPDQGGWRLSSGKALARLTGLNAPWPNLHVLTADYESWPPTKRPNQALERTAARHAFAFGMIKTVLVAATLAPSGGRSAWSR